MKQKIILFLLSLFSIIGYSQEIEGVSKSHSFNITKDPPKPPILIIVPGSVEFIDTDGNKCLNAGESATISLIVENKGYGAGIGLTASLATAGFTNGVIFKKSTSIKDIPVGGKINISLPIAANLNTTKGSVTFTLKIDEPNGFGSDAIELEVRTKAFEAPLVKVTDYTVSSTTSETLEKKRPFDLQVLIQNTQYGLAENVIAELVLPDENIFCLSANLVSELGVLKAGETQNIIYTLVVNERYPQNSISLKIKLSERHSKYAENKSISLTLKQQLATEKTVIASNITDSDKPGINIASLSAEVDKNIPVNPKVNNRVALIIGNEDYSSYQNGLSSESNVDYAINDASIFRKYALNTFGVKEENMYYIANATASIMNQKIELVSKIVAKMGAEAELIFYYSGHGYPDEKTKEPYLIPVDVSATNLQMAIKLVDIYKKFSESGANRITLFLDACFSGGGRTDGLIAARAVRIKPKEQNIKGNMIVFSASTGEQTALPYHDKKHGMFTYYLLKKLQDSKGQLTYRELKEYLERTVSLESLKINSKEQDPTVKLSQDIVNSWQSWIFN